MRLSLPAETLPKRRNVQFSTTPNGVSNIILVIENTCQRAAAHATTFDREPLFILHVPATTFLSSVQLQGLPSLQPRTTHGGKGTLVMLVCNAVELDYCNSTVFLGTTFVSAMTRQRNKIT